MFCPNCGTNLPDNSTFCSNCGAQINNPAPQQQYQPPQQPYQPPYQPPYEPYNTMGNTMPMKWYKFLIYFALFAGAVLNIINGIMMLTGSQYDGSASLVYAFFDGLQAIDMIVGAACIGLAALQIYTRFRLSGYYQNAAKFVSITYIAAVVINLFYIIGVLVVLPSSVTEYLDFSTFIVQIVISALMVVVNNTYFNKRKHLFQKI